LVADSTTGTLNRPIAVLIAYHFSTVCMVGQIVVIEGNRHDERILKGGRYAKRFDMQVAFYR